MKLCTCYNGCSLMGIPDTYQVTHREWTDLIVVAETHIPLFSLFLAIGFLVICMTLYGVCYDNHDPSRHMHVNNIHTCMIAVNNIHAHIYMTRPVYIVSESNHCIVLLIASMHNHTNASGMQLIHTIYFALPVCGYHYYTDLYAPQQGTIMCLSPV